MRKLCIVAIILLGLIIAHGAWKPLATGPGLDSPSLSPPIREQILTLPVAERDRRVGLELPVLTSPNVQEKLVPIPTRAVTITVFVDDELLAGKERDATILQVTGLMHNASERFQDYFNITFFYAIKPWHYPTGKNELEVYAARDDVDQLWQVGSSDLAIAFTKKGLYTQICNPSTGGESNQVCSREYHGGVAYILGNAAIVSLHWTSPHALLHEIGHLFGVRHSDALTPSVMSSDPPMIDTFDENTKTIILKNRNRIFRPSPAP